MEDARKEGGRWFCSPSCLMQGSSGNWKRQKRRGGPARTVGKVVKWTLIVIGVLAVAVVALALVGRNSAKSKGGAAPATAGNIRADINRTRHRAHLKPLKPDPAASLLAAAHSDSMAQRGRLTAVPRKDLDPFLLSGRRGDVYQVVVSFSGGSLPSTGEVVSYMMRAHGGRARRRGVLNPNHNRVGIGVTRRASSLWATAIFITAPK
jgi:Cysteine-rich secretory protein family